MLSYAASFGADDKVIVVPDPDIVSPGFLGFVVVFLLAAATVLLIRSMVRHVRKVQYTPDPAAQTPSQMPPTSTPTSRPGSA